MNVITRKLVSIDVDVTANDLIESWMNGNKTYVLDKLENDHPALVALMIVQGSQDRSLSLSDCNEIANKLIDRRVALLKESE